MAERSRYGTRAPWEQQYGYSRAVRAGSMITVSGTVGRNADGTTPKGAYAQAQRALAIIEESLHALGAGVEHVVRTRTFVVDIGLFEEVARAHAEVFGDVRPATSLVAISALIAPEYLLEIEADAVLD